MEQSHSVMFPRPTAVSLTPGGIFDFRFAYATNRQEGGAHFGPKPSRLSRPPQIDEFLSLASAKSDEAIIRAAGKHGPLLGLNGIETVEDWRRFSRLAGCILAAGQSLATGMRRLVSDEDWQLVSEFAGTERPRTIRLRQFCVAMAIDKWLELGGQYRVRPVWLGDSLETQFVPTTLLGAIGLALADAIHGRDTKQRCFECGHWFPTRRMLPGHRRFCKTCGRRAAMKYVMRDRRARQKAA